MEHITNSGKSWNITNQITSNVYGAKMGNSSKQNLIYGDVPAIPIPIGNPPDPPSPVFLQSGRPTMVWSSVFSGHEFMAEI